MNNKTNEALRLMALAAYQRRPSLPAKYQTMFRLEQVNGGLLCDVWFMSGGCSHDTRGGCTMCNYGKSNGRIHQKEILTQIHQTIQGFSKSFEDFLLTPSGSILDEREVSPEFLEQLLEEVEQVQAKRFIVETRADTISEEKLNCFDRLKKRMDCYIEIGLESSSDWILKHCVNKGMTVDDFKKAVMIVHKAGLKVTANIGIGIPFLNERFSVSHTIQTIKDALCWGVDSVVLFPYHINQGTVLRDMERLGLYQCISMWSLIEVLWHFINDDLDRIQISWYKDYYEKGASGICTSPVTCKQCEENVGALLDRYRNEQERSVLNSLHSIHCDCRNQWIEMLKKEPETVDYHQIEKKYLLLASYYGIDHDLLGKELSGMKEDFHKMKMDEIVKKEGEAWTQKRNC